MSKRVPRATAAQLAARALGKRGGLTTAKNRTADQRSASARHASLARWGAKKATA